ncbi:unnamed protein product [Toxocara canis]|uniref:ZP domain-containing protein n=1 Tax=Toxocara canis TaxID=6265 RepID=A0A183UFS0_TOXCA|nr:unnamed protein product [Toxocara canis]
MPFMGRVYVRGLADDEKCSRSMANNIEQTTFSMVIQNGDCAMQKQRVAGTLEGVMFSLTIIVSFHSTFVTMADRAYRCMCFFRSIKRLSSELDIFPIGVNQLHNTVKMPSCTYTIRTGSVNGRQVTYGQVGERIYHVWQCDDEAQTFFVHSCFVTDGRGNRFDLVDADGCSIDRAVQPELEYDLSANRVVAPTWGYKFSQTSLLNYQCVLEMCNIVGCEKHLPPYCGSEKREFERCSAKLLFY